MCSEDKSINNLSTGPPENVSLKLIRSGQSATIACTAEAHPEPSLKIFFNCGMMVARSVKTYTITEVNNSHVGVYQCVAANILGQRSSVPIFLTLNGKPSHSSTKIYNILSYIDLFFIDNTVFRIVNTARTNISIKNKPNHNEWQCYR